MHNPWLTYGIGLHRLREAGLLPDIIDGIDERPFTLDQLHKFCIALFLGDNSGVKLPHPRESLPNFFQKLKMLVDKERMQWNPIRKKMMPWIDLKLLEASHGRRSRNRDNHRSKSVHDPPRDKQQAMPKKYERSSSEPSPNVSANVHRQPSTPPCNPLQHFLLTVPHRLPPTNTTVEMHEYFSKWKTFDEDAFDGFSGDELAELLRKGLYSAVLHLL